MPRRRGMVLLSILIVALSLRGAPAQGAERPNILWITCEDTSPHLGCYGDDFAVTPCLDRLADESVRYTRAFAYTGVCAPSRSCLITGVYPLRLGSHHMRSTTTLPDDVKCFPEYLRAAGYYCSNNVKTDYNFAVPNNAWDDSSTTAHWRNRPEGRPFFSVFNFTVCHQSRIFATATAHRRDIQRLTREQFRDPAGVTIPPIHPDTPEFRREWAWHYENVTAMDYQVGDVLRELQEDGLADETIVFFFSDHGTGMPAVKMYAWHMSLWVPLLVRFPEQWQSFAPAAPGETTDRLVSFVDFAPTVLSLCGVDIPAHMQGTAFLGAQAEAPRRYVYGGKDRQGECCDTIRYAHDGRLHYLRNFQPHLPWAQYMSYNQQHASLRRWRTMDAAGELAGPTARYFQTKPTEELYDVEADPWEVRNLAADPAYAADLARLREECRNWMLRTGDLGLLTEHELHARANAADKTPCDIALDPALNPLEQLLAAADLANARDPAQWPRLLQLLEAEDACVRWWGTVGLLALGAEAAPALDRLRAATRDPSPDVRIAAAQALARLGRIEETLPVLRAALQDQSPPVRLAALQAMHRIGPPAAPLIADLPKAALRRPGFKDVGDYIDRMIGYLPERLEGSTAR